jgi:CBS domain-containing protein
MIETTVGSVACSFPPTTTPETSVREAARYLRSPEVPALVVFEEGTVVGVVTGSDVVALVAETDERPPVRAVMSNPVATVRPTATLSAAAETMRTTGVRHLPVVGDGGYGGVVSARSLAPYLPRNALDVEWRGDPLRYGSAAGPGVTADD